MKTQITTYKGHTIYKNDNGTYTFDDLGYNFTDMYYLVKYIKFELRGE